MRACILSIGSELMLGQITDTNASWLARDLADAGVELVQVTQVGDDLQLMLRALRSALELADLVICTGGIGPTDDDMTREAVATLVGETPEVDQEILAEIETYFSDMGRVMPERNAKQAWMIRSAESITNPVGTAPGWFVTIKGNPEKYVLTMPGVPREMYRMWLEQMKPRVLARTESNIIDSIHIKTTGIGESDAEDRIHDLILQGDPQVATYAKDDGVHIRVTAVGVDADETRMRRDGVRDEVYRRLGEFIWGVDEETLAGVIASQLSDRGLSLVVHEVGTGGALASLLNSDPVAARSFVRDIVEPGGNGVRIDQFPLDELDEQVQVSIEYIGEVDGHAVGRGTMRMVLRHASLTEPIDHDWQIRGSLTDIQRRVGLNAVHAIHTWLRQTSD